MTRLTLTYVLLLSSTLSFSQTKTKEVSKTRTLPNLLFKIGKKIN